MVAWEVDGWGLFPSVFLFFSGKATNDLSSPFIETSSAFVRLKMSVSESINSHVLYTLSLFSAFLIAVALLGLVTLSAFSS